jgi:hypothetical protein
MPHIRKKPLSDGEKAFQNALALGAVALMGSMALTVLFQESSGQDKSSEGNNLDSIECRCQCVSTKGKVDDATPTAPEALQP